MGCFRSLAVSGLGSNYKIYWTKADSGVPESAACPLPTQTEPALKSQAALSPTQHHLRCMDNSAAPAAHKGFLKRQLKPSSKVYYLGLVACQKL